MCRIPEAFPTQPMLSARAGAFEMLLHLLLLLKYMLLLLLNVGTAVVATFLGIFPLEAITLRSNVLEALC